MRKSVILCLALLLGVLTFHTYDLLQPSYVSAASASNVDADFGWDDPDDTLPDSGKSHSGGSGSSDDSDDSEDTDEDDSTWMPEWVQSLIKKIDNLFQTFQDLMSGKLIHDAIQGLVVMWVDEMLTPLYNVFAKSYLFTPRLAEIGVVFKSWSFISLMSFAALMIGTIILAINIARGKEDLKLLLRSFLISLVALILSMTVLNILNVLVNWATQISLQGIIGTTNIQYQGLTGQQIMKSVLLGADGITEATYEAQTVGQIAVATEGGLFSLLAYVLFIALPLWILSVAKSLLLMIMAIFVGGWITYTAYSGKVETLAGYTNLYIRTLLVGYFCAVHWAVFVKQQTDYGVGEGFSAEIGIPPLFFACFSVVLLFIFFYFFWFKPLVKAVQQPITLGGGNVIEQAGNWGQRLSKSMNAIGKRLGSESLQKKSLSWEDKSKRMSEVGERMKNQKSIMMSRAASSITAGISEEMQGIKYQAPDIKVERGQSVVSQEAVSLMPEVEVLTDASAAAMYKALKPQGFQRAAVIEVKSPDQALKMPEAVEKINRTHAGAVSWNADVGEILVKNTSSAVLKELSQLGISTEQAEQGYAKSDVFVSAKSQRIKQFNEQDPESQAVFSNASKALGAYQKVRMSPGEAKEVQQSLLDQKSKKKNMGWVSEVRVDSTGLIIPAHAMKHAMPVIQSVMNHVSDKKQVNLPRNSAFLEGMLADWAKSPETAELARMVEPLDNGYSALVPQRHVSDFERHLDRYKMNRTLYWKTKKGRYMTIKDGVPFDIGAVPSNGLNMGSYEKFQEEAMHKHMNQSESPSKGKGKGGKE